jgi:hypothetical protein
MKMATAYQRGAIFVIHALSRTTDGVWIATQPFIRLPEDCSSDELSGAVQAALDRSKDRVRHPDQDQWKKVLEPLLNAAGVKSWRTFVRGSTSVEIESDATGLALIPTNNLRGREGYEAIDTERITVPLNATSDTIGLRLREAFSRAG